MKSFRVTVDVNRDGVRDVITRPVNSKNQILDGRMGAVLTTLVTASDDLREFEPIGDANGDGFADLGLVRDPIQRCGFNVTALSGKTGKVLWERDFTVSGDEWCGDRYGRAAGDVDADGVRDFYATIGTENATLPHNYVISGRTGTLRDGVALGDPLLGAVDGHGADFLTSASNAKLQLTVRDGRTRQVLWSFSDPATRYVAASAVSLTADNRAEVVVHTSSVASHKRGAIVLNGATGKVLWRVSL